MYDIVTTWATKLHRGLRIGPLDGDKPCPRCANEAYIEKLVVRYKVRVLREHKRLLEEFNRAQSELVAAYDAITLRTERLRSTQERIKAHNMGPRHRQRHKRVLENLPPVLRSDRLEKTKLGQQTTAIWGPYMEAHNRYPARERRIQVLTALASSLGDSHPACEKCKLRFGAYHFAGEPSGVLCYLCIRDIELLRSNTTATTTSTTDHNGASLPSLPVVLL